MVAGSGSRGRRTRLRMGRLQLFVFVPVAFRTSSPSPVNATAFGRGVKTLSPLDRSAHCNQPQWCDRGQVDLPGPGDRRLGASPGQLVDVATFAPKRAQPLMVGAAVLVTDRKRT